jgi:hypothetical protein
MSPFVYAMLPAEIQDVVRHTVDSKDLDGIIEQVFGINPGTLFTKTRERETCNGRQLFGAIMFHTTRLSLTSIGKTSGKNHATIIHARKNISRWLVNEKSFRHKTIRVLYEFHNSKYQYLEKEYRDVYIRDRVEETITAMILNRSRKKASEDHICKSQDTDIIHLKINKTMAEPVRRECYAETA